MVGKWLVGVAVLLSAVTGCTPAPPPYESRYTTPPPLPPPPPPLAPGASFIEDFNRENTPRGLGAGWEMRGIGDDGSLLPAESGAFIRDGHYVSSDDSGVYAVRTFRGTVRRVGTEGRWTRVGDGGDETLVMGIAATGNPGGDLVQLTVTKAGWAVSSRRGGGDPRSVVRGTFDPPLEENRTYQFEMDAADGTVTVRVPGAEKETKLGTIGLLSEQAYWQHYSAPNQIPIGAKFCIDNIWAAEQGQPLSPAPAPSSAIPGP